MTLGVWLTAGLQLRAVVCTVGQPCLPSCSGSPDFAVWAPMVLAVAWAAGPALGSTGAAIPDMARTHGLANALAFRDLWPADDVCRHRSPQMGQ